MRVRRLKLKENERRRIEERHDWDSMAY